MQFCLKQALEEEAQNKFEKKMKKNLPHDFWELPHDLFFQKKFF